MRIKISYKSILKVLGYLLTIEGFLLLVPLAVEIADGESEWLGFVIASCLGLLSGQLMVRLPGSERPVLRRREGFLLVSTAWVVCSLVGMIPFMMSGHPLSLSDAFFETVSGFTTTGATTIADVEALSRGVLLWRSMTQWVGGLGIILFILALLPQLNEDSGLAVFNAETTGITHDKLHPRIRNTASALWKVYVVLSVVTVGLLWAGPMSFFDALNQAMTAVSTGGFSTRNASIAFWHSDYINGVLTVSMLLGGVNFALLYGAWKGRWRELMGNDVLKAYLLIVGACYALILLSMLLNPVGGGVDRLFFEPLFHVVSAITTTGFSLGDFSGWGQVSLMVTFLLMFSGACAGSTTGAVKVDRLVVLWKNISNEVKKVVQPKRITAVRVNGTLVPQTELGRILAFVAIYIGLIGLGTLVLCFYGIGLTDSAFAVMSCLGTNGLGYGLTGAAGGFHLLPDVVKWLLALLMLAGRLELFSVVVLFFPAFWRK